MPAAAFNAADFANAAIAAHTLVPMDSGVLTTLEAEDFLLVQSCTRTGSSERLQEIDWQGKLVLDVHFNTRLIYQVSAFVLGWEGLADYHPGRALSDRALSFANGKQAMQFQNTGTLVYMDPKQGISGGALPSVEFTVERLFVDLNYAAYPTGGVAESIVYVPDQSAVELSAAAYEHVLKAIFEGAVPVSGPVTATLFNGAPGAGGVAVSAVLTVPMWGPVTVLSGDQAVIEAPEIVWPSTSGARTVTHIRVQNGAQLVTDIPLAASLSVPSGKQVRALRGSLSILADWPNVLTNGITPAGEALRYLLAGLLLRQGSGTLWARLLPTADPNVVPLVSVPLPRNPTAWAMPGLTQIQLDQAQQSSELAPPGGWQVRRVVVTLDDSPTWWNVIDAVFTVPENSRAELASGALALDVGLLV